MRVRSSLVAGVAVLGLALAAHAQEGGEPPEEPEPTPSPPPEPTPSPPTASSILSAAEEIVGLVGASPADARVVTSSGRVLARLPDGSGWTHVSSGAVSAPIVQARSFGAEVWATGATPPAFRFSTATSTWNAEPVRRAGSARLSTCAALGFAAGRRAFVHDGAKWRELRGLPRGAPLRSLCFIDLTHAAALLDDGSLLFLQGGWRPLPLPGGARAAWLGGGATILVTTEQGELYRLDTGKPARVAIDPGAPSLPPRAAFGDAKHTWLLVGDSVLRLDGRRLVPLATLPAELGQHDWIGLLASSDGTLVLAARDGAIAWRSTAGTWSTCVATTAPTDPVRPANPPAYVGP